LTSRAGSLVGASLPTPRSHPGFTGYVPFVPSPAPAWHVQSVPAGGGGNVVLVVLLVVVEVARVVVVVAAAAQRALNAVMRATTTTSRIDGVGALATAVPTDVT